LAIGPGAVSVTSLAQSIKPIDRYEDQVVPAAKNKRKDLEEEILEYEKQL
jgi:hypothetical protein